jgi:hypothetical protein
MNDQTLLDVIKGMNRHEAEKWVAKNHGVAPDLARQIVAVELGETTFNDTGAVPDNSPRAKTNRPHCSIVVHASKVRIVKSKRV